MPGQQRKSLSTCQGVGKTLPSLTTQGYAVKAGMLCARGELLLMADADGATVAAEEQRLEEALQQVKVCTSRL